MWTRTKPVRARPVPATRNLLPMEERGPANASERLIGPPMLEESNRESRDDDPRTTAGRQSHVMVVVARVSGESAFGGAGSQRGLLYAESVIAQSPGSRGTASAPWVADPRFSTPKVLHQRPPTT